MNLFRRSATFAGGMKLPGKKELSRTAAIESPPLPARVTIPLWQHAGTPAKPCVTIGQRVLTGQIIAVANGPVSSPVHASVSDAVSAIRDIGLPGNQQSQAVTIESDGRDQKVLYTPVDPWNRAEPATLLSRIDEAGVVGLGGAAFPAKVKLMPPPEKKVDILLINGAECEPYLTADFRIMVERAREAVAGIRILLRVLGVSKAIIGIERHSTAAIRSIEKAVAGDGAIAVRALEVKYPHGAEKILIKSLLNREVPSGRLPIDAGVIVHNVGTAEAVYQAVCVGRPLYERVITVSGEAIARPKNLLVRIGTPVSHLVAFCHGMTHKQVSVIVGGPMMGTPIDTLDTPAIKGMPAILVLPSRKTYAKDDIVCINCGRCLTACPLGLNPAELVELGNQNLIDEAKREGVLDCCQCGLCSAVCPGGRQNTEIIKKLKEAAMKGVRQ
ncbi:MAG: electron transport complex subunit RsxC [Chitinispirillaceae bacterium]|nr:electron transport complex subunit RsxC [Chitinispirillaceae bacterium]